jgi:hypothetical protein
MKEMGILMAIARALANVAKGTATAVWNVADWGWRAVWSLWPLSGGGSGAVMPPKKLDLPDVEEAHEAKAVAAAQHRAADFTLSSPERVAQAWARASKEDRDTLPLTKLTTEQIDWLEVHLSNEQIKILANERSETKVAAALAGREDAIFGVPSVGQTREKKSDGALTDRIAAFRAGGIEKPPAFLH